MIQDYLRRIGLAAEIERVDRAVVWGRMGVGDFDAGVHVLQTHTGWSNRYFGKDSIVGYENPRVAEALSRAEDTADLDALDALYVEIGKEFARDPWSFFSRLPPFMPFTIAFEGWTRARLELL